MKESSGNTQKKAKKVWKKVVKFLSSEDSWYGILAIGGILLIILLFVSVVRTCRSDHSKKVEWIEHKKEINLGTLMAFPDTAGVVTLEELLRETSSHKISLVIQGKEDGGLYVLSGISEDNVVFVLGGGKNKAVLKSGQYAESSWYDKDMADPIQYIRDHPEDFGKLYIYLPEDSIPVFIRREDKKKRRD